MTEANELAEAAKALLDDVRARYPGEALRCPHMIRLDEAVSSLAPKPDTTPDGVREALQRMHNNLASAPPDAVKCFASLDDHRTILTALTQSPRSCCAEERWITIWRKTGEKMLEWDFHVSDFADDVPRVVANLKSDGVKQYSTYSLGALVPEQTAMEYHPATAIRSADHAG